MAVQDAALRTPVRLALVVASVTALTGCASISLPFASLSGDDTPRAITTASVSDTADQTPATEMPPPLATAVAPTGPVDSAAGERAVARSVAEAETRPTDELVAALERNASNPVSFSQAELDGLSGALTRALREDEQVGTFSWSAGNKAGLMTPFRATGSEPGACRMVSVEVTSTPRDAIILADACQRGDGWAFTSPRAGEAL
ncbi:MAG: hypothetical protein KI785_12385 [Devosiaceae bacterium]|nr:hypothetical protein [Devosiaceae bacterium MH13]